MADPPPYPRTPHLWPTADHPRRLVVPADEIESWLRSPVIVEEKLDGANVSLWWADGVHVASRGGSDAMDRAGQLGRLRAWASERAGVLGPLIADGHVLYGEWLWVRHGVAYDALPDWLVALDLWHPAHGFSDVEDRDARCAASGLALPPRLFSGVLNDRQTVERLMTRSAWAPGQPAEGMILRDESGRRCKIVRGDFVRRSDAAWAGEREHNQLSPSARSFDGGEGASSGPSS